MFSTDRQPSDEGYDANEPVVVFDPAKGYAVAASFFAYEPTFTGGMTVAVGGATGDGVTGTGPAARRG